MDEKGWWKEVRAFSIGSLDTKIISVEVTVQDVVVGKGIGLKKPKINCRLAKIKLDSRETEMIGMPRLLDDWKYGTSVMKKLYNYLWLIENQYRN